MFEWLLWELLDNMLIGAQWDEPEWNVNFNNVF
jgi:hypothetical protein